MRQPRRLQNFCMGTESTPDFGGNRTSKNSPGPTSVALSATGGFTPSVGVDLDNAISVLSLSTRGRPILSRGRLRSGSTSTTDSQRWHSGQDSDASGKTGQARRSRLFPMTVRGRGAVNTPLMESQRTTLRRTFQGDLPRTQRASTCPEPLRLPVFELSPLPPGDYRRNANRMRTCYSCATCSAGRLLRHSLNRVRKRRSSVLVPGCVPWPT
jgi:hypothetical protein